jgi:hypothetical protein
MFLKKFLCIMVACIVFLSGIVVVHASELDNPVFEDEDNPIEDPDYYVVVAGVSLPGIPLGVTVQKQQYYNYCSAATVLSVAKYFNPSTTLTQYDIYTYGFNGYDPTLEQLKDYLNGNYFAKPSYFTSYIRRYSASTQQSFTADLKYDVENYQPMVLIIRHPYYTTTNWPYYTAAHFCLCLGVDMNYNNKYVIGDPYYFSSWVTSATANNGIHRKTWTQLSAVINTGETWARGYLK